MSRRLGSSYTLIAPIGRGAMGEVWRGHSEDGSVYAFKLLRAELAVDEELVARFLRERSILCRISSPHTVQVHDLVAEGGQLAIVMDFVAGADLRQQIRRRRTFPPSAAVTRAIEILDGVGAAHQLGVVHRDVKPENILVAAPGTDSERALVTDFGIARLLDGTSSLTKLSGTLGTPHYMAPEVIEAGRAEPRADLYAVGIILYELLCGVSPFADRPPLLALRAHLDLIPGQPAGMPEPLWEVVSRLLAKDPADRPQTAEEATNLLTAAVRGLEQAPAAPALDVPPPATQVSVPTAHVLRTELTRMGTWRDDSADPLAQSEPDDSPPAGQEDSSPPSGGQRWPSGGQRWPSGGQHLPGSGRNPSVDRNAASGTTTDPWAPPAAASQGRRWPAAQPYQYPPVSQRHWSPGHGAPGGYAAWPYPPPAPGRPARRPLWRRLGRVVVILLVISVGVSALLTRYGSRATRPDPVELLERGATDDPRAEITVRLAEARQLFPRGAVTTGEETVNSVAMPHSVLITVPGGQLPNVGSVEYDLGRRFLRLKTTAGIPDDAGSSAKFLMEVHGDGALLAQFTAGLGASFPIDVDVTGILRLRFSATLLGEANDAAAYSSPAVFGDARVVGRWE